MVNARQHMGINSFIALRDVEAGPIECEVTGLSIESTAYQEDALVCDLKCGRRLVLNADRTIAMCRIAGSDETNDWSGVRVRLYSGEVKGRPAVRINFPGGAVVSAEDELKAANDQLAQAASDEGDDDSIPF